MHHSPSVPKPTVSWQDSSPEDSVRSKAKVGEDTESTLTHGKRVTFHGTEESELHKMSKHKLDALRASTDKLFHSKRDENKGMKAVFGALAGLVIGGLLFVLLVESFGYTPLVAGIIVALSTVIICFGLAMWSTCRCVMALVLPNFFTGKGRAVFLSVTFGVMLAGPITNITLNAKETGSSMACVLDIISKQTKALHEPVVQSAEKVAHYITQQRDKLDRIKDIMVVDFDEITNGVRKVGEELRSVNIQMNKLYEDCRRPVASAVNECTGYCSKLFINDAIRDVFSDAIRGCRTQCSKLNELSNICSPFRIGENLEEVATKIRSPLRQVEDYFKANIRIEGDFSAKANSSKSVKTIQKEVDTDIDANVNSLLIFKEIVTKALSLSLLLMFLQAFWYFKNYMAKDGYDNIYITKAFKELDEKTGVNGEEVVLPLKTKERSNYIFTLSPKLSRKELGYSRFGLAQVLLHALLCSVLILTDYTLYYILNLVNRFGKIELDVRGQGRLEVSVVGNGPIAEFYKQIFSGLNIYEKFMSNIDFEGCLPNPKAPQEKYIVIFIFLYLLTLTFVILQAYGMRLRRKIAAYYYPEQEAARIEYLHKTIRHRRNAYRRFLRQEIQSIHKESVMKEKFRVSTWLVEHLPCTAKCIPSRGAIECTSCGDKEGMRHHVKLTKCTGTQAGEACTAVYCDDCLAALQYVCPLCTSKEVELRE